MTVLLWTIPLMVVTVVVATIPVLTAMIGEHRRHQGRNGHLGQPVSGPARWGTASHRTGPADQPQEREFPTPMAA